MLAYTVATVLTCLLQTVYSAEQYVADNTTSSKMILIPKKKNGDKLMDLDGQVIKRVVAAGGTNDFPDIAAKIPSDGHLEACLLDAGGHVNTATCNNYPKSRMDACSVEFRFQGNPADTNGNCT